MIIIVVSVIVLFVGIVFLTMKFDPRFGGELSENKKEIYNNSSNFKEGKFINKNELNVSPKITISGFIRALGGMLAQDSTAIATIPKTDIKVQHINRPDILTVKDSTRLVWFGHSTFLLQLENKNILIDPMFGKVPSPYSWLGTKRFSTTLPISIEKLPKIDVVLLSHDHYDHLDYGSILKLKDKVEMFYIPLGVGMHLEKWGVEKERIVELDWWEEAKLDNLIFRCTPSQHSSDRKLNAMSNTLWSSWIINSNKMNIFFSGDGGYGKHFKEIGDKYGPFDFAMLECGQYNEQWPLLHMFPEQTAQAGIDIKAKQIMPIHWGAFRLSNHAWEEPVERLIAAAEKLHIPVIFPKIGEPILIEPIISYSNESWWENY
ncbi:MBL fold metallo-hydrolase [Zobellia barbeyronii]|uniref:MBL fold metallo-hydrolase n=1 Tax=Zobellia barbeyronii TaxID=2748009 RepID=A0ABS5WAX5_9FLAO|nr:MBL fold metallo-hydrolase [Zobellia barbeyronii]MBT2160545.1 MBL fold metallo-hydrolase [Zobellia barbeyronii]